MLQLLCGEAVAGSLNDPSPSQVGLVFKHREMMSAFGHSDFVTMGTGLTLAFCICLTFSKEGI